MKLTFTHNGKPVELDATLEGNSLHLNLPDGSIKTAAVRRLADGLEIRDGDRVYRIPTARHGRGGVSVSWEGRGYEFGKATPGSSGTQARKGKVSGVVVAPMVGTVAAVKVEPGDTVTAYQPLVVIEAMKVLATLEAPFAGTVRAVLVTTGQAVQQGAALVEIMPEEGKAGDAQ